MHWVNKSGFQEKNINISTIRVISYQSEKQCFSLQYNLYIIFFREDLILSPICTIAMHILRRRRRAVKWCVVHLPMQNKFVVVVIVYPKRLVSLLPPCFSCILCNDVSTPDKHWLIFIVYFISSWITCYQKLLQAIIKLFLKFWYAYVLSRWVLGSKVIIHKSRGGVSSRGRHNWISFLAYLKFIIKFSRKKLSFFLPSF